MSRRKGNRFAVHGANILAAAVCVTLPVVWWRYKLAASTANDTVNFFNFDQYHYTFPVFRYAAEQLRHGRFPLWTPQQLCGGPFLAPQLHGILYPLHWLIVSLPLAAVWRVLLLGHSILAMSGAFVCARSFGVRRSAALLAGVMYAFSGLLTGAATFAMEPVLVSHTWLPWQLACVRATLRSPCHWVVAAVGLGVTSALCVVGGHLPFLPVAIVVCGLYAVLELAVLAWQLGPWRAAVRAVRLCLGAAVAAGLAAVQLLPTLELVGRSVRVGAFPSVRAADPFPIAPSELLVGLINSLPTHFGYADRCFMGVAAVGLALVPFIDRRYYSRALVLWVVGTFVTLLALGASTPVFGWYLSVQGSSIRIPERFLLGMTLSLALLSALGVDALCRARRSVLILLAVCLTIAVPFVLGVAVPADSVAKVSRRAAIVAGTRSDTWWIAGIGGVFLLHWSWCRRWLRPGAVLLATGLIACELYGSMSLKMAIPATYPNALKIPTGAAAFVRAHAGTARVVTPLSPGWTKDAIPVRVGMLENVQAISDYEPLVDRRFAEVMWTLSSSSAGPFNAHLGPFMNDLTEQALPLLRFLGVGFVMVASNGGVQVRLPGPIYNDADAAVYAVPDPLPRAYVAKDVRTASTPEQARLTVLADTAWVLRDGAIVENAEFHGTGSDGSVTIRRDDAEVVDLEADLARPGLVVLEDEYDPYWRASVDGVEAPILRTNYVFRGVAVAAGRHSVRFWYHPTLIYAGAMVSLLTLVALLAASILWLRRCAVRRASVTAGVTPRPEKSTADYAD